MPTRLERRYGAKDLHFVTCSCYQRRPLLSDDRVKQLFLEILEDVRREYGFCVIGYVLMPEHFHLLMSQPESGAPSVVLQVLKQRVSRQVHHRNLLSPTLSPEAGERMWHPQFWKRRYYDFNVWTARKRVEKLRYIHRNPVKRGLVEKPEVWPWSSFRNYATGEEGVVEIESPSTARKRERAGIVPRVRNTTPTRWGL